MKRKRETLDDGRISKKLKVNHVVMKISKEKSPNLAFFNCRIPKPKRTKMNLEKKKGHIKGSDGFFNYGGNLLKKDELNSHYMIGELDVKSGILNVKKPKNVFEVERFFKDSSELVDKFDVSNFETHSHKQFKDRKEKYESQKTKFKETGSKIPKYHEKMKNVDLDRDYIPPVKPSASEIKKIYPWRKAISATERGLIPTEFLVDESKLDSYPKVILHYYESSKKFSKKKRIILYYYKYLCYLINLKQRFGFKSFRSNMYYKDQSVLKMEDDQLWSLLLKKFSKLNGNNYVITDVHKQKIVSYALALLMHIERFSLDEDLLKKIMVDMKTSFQVLLNFGKSMGLKVSKDKDKSYKMVLKKNFKLPSFLELEKMKKRKKRK